MQRQPPKPSKAAPAIGAAIGETYIAITIYDIFSRTTLSSNESRAMTMASVMAAAPTPWMMRYAINIASDDARTHPTLARTKMMQPNVTTGLRPYRSETGPKISGAMPKLII